MKRSFFLAIAVGGILSGQRMAFCNSIFSKKAFHGFIQDLQEMQKVISPEKKITIQGAWYSEERDAVVTLNPQKEPTVTIYGGLARHPAMTRDVLKLFLCHELGHIFGGSPKVRRGGSLSSNSWSSVEGQADYYATAKCLPRLFGESIKGIDAQLEAEHLLQQFPAIQIHCSGEDVLCIKVAATAIQTASVIANLTHEPWQPDLEHPDITQVSETLTGHPSAQCRLDTFMAGLHCRNRVNEEFASEPGQENSCDQANDGAASRPRCWFAP